MSIIKTVLCSMLVVVCFAATTFSQAPDAEDRERMRQERLERDAAQAAREQRRREREESDEQTRQLFYGTDQGAAVQGAAMPKKPAKKPISGPGVGPDLGTTVKPHRIGPTKSKASSGSKKDVSKGNLGPAQGVKKGTQQFSPSKNLEMEQRRQQEITRQLLEQKRKSESENLRQQQEVFELMQRRDDNLSLAGDTGDVAEATEEMEPSSQSGIDSDAMNGSVEDAGDSPIEFDELDAVVDRYFENAEGQSQLEVTNESMADGAEVLESIETLGSSVENARSFPSESLDAVNSGSEDHVDDVEGVAASPEIPQSNDGHGAVDREEFKTFLNDLNLSDISSANVDQSALGSEKSTEAPPQGSQMAIDPEAESNGEFTESVLPDAESSYVPLEAGEAENIDPIVDGQKAEQNDSSMSPPSAFVQDPMGYGLIGAGSLVDPNIQIGSGSAAIEETSLQSKASLIDRVPSNVLDESGEATVGEIDEGAKGDASGRVAKESFARIKSLVKEMADMPDAIEHGEKTKKILSRMRKERELIAIHQEKLLQRKRAYESLASKKINLTQNQEADRQQVVRELFEIETGRREVRRHLMQIMLDEI